MAANAWGTECHKVIAFIAQSQLTPKARTEVERLLALEPAMTLAAVDRLVHHSTILEMNVESYRRRAAQARWAPPVRKARSTK